jgi:hypothetical protein
MFTPDASGDYTLRATKANFAATDLPYTIDGSSLVTKDFLMPYGPGLHGRVTAADLPGNKPIPGAKISAVGATYEYETVTDLYGYYHITASDDSYDLQSRGFLGLPDIFFDKRHLFTAYTAPACCKLQHYNLSFQIRQFIRLTSCLINGKVRSLITYFDKVAVFINLGLALSCHA